MPVSTEDHVAISDHMARYCWAVDSGDEDGWIALWTEDGHFSGATPEPLQGREALRTAVRMAQMAGPGMLRHSITNMFCDYMDGKDRVLACYYNMVTTWAGGARMTLMALSKVQLVRDGAKNGGGWLVARNETEVLPG